jgi:Protein of unknown function (DUF998)
MRSRTPAQAHLWRDHGVHALRHQDRTFGGKHFESRFAELRSIANTPGPTWTAAASPWRSSRDSLRGDAPRTGEAVRELRLHDESPLLRPLRFLGFVGMSGFVVAVVALHVLQHALNPAEYTISDYALGSYGWLMRSAFFTLGVGTLATVGAIRLRHEPSVRRRLGLVLLAGTAVGLFIDSGYNTDHPHVPATVDGMVHGVGTWIFALTLTGAAFILGSYFAHTSVSAWRGRAIQALSAAQLVAMVVFEISPDAYRGLSERVVALLAVTTLARLLACTAPTLGSQLRRPPERPAVVDRGSRGRTSQSLRQGWTREWEVADDHIPRFPR